MKIKVFVLETSPKTLSVFLSLVLLLCLSCSKNAQKEDFSKSTQIKNKSNNLPDSDPIATVTKFMEFVSENDLEKANNLIRIDQAVLEKPKARREMPVRLDWGRVIKERELSLENISNSDISEKYAVVKTRLKHRVDSRITMGANFSLVSIEDQWFISDIEFITDMNKS